MNEKISYKTARFFDGLLDRLLLIFILLLLAFGAYSMYDIYSTMHSGDLPDKITKFRPIIEEAVEEQPNELTFQELQAINPDTIAWLAIDNTALDYPIVQTDNNAKYLNTAVTGEPSVSGAIFMDWQNEPDFTDVVTMVYGHNMADFAMFGCIPPMKEAKEFAKADYGWLFLPKTTYKVRVMAVVDTTTLDLGYYDILKNKTIDPQEFVEYVKSNSVQFRDLSGSPGKRYIVLSTCSDSGGGRCLLILKILRKGGENIL